MKHFSFPRRLLTLLVAVCTLLVLAACTTPSENKIKLENLEFVSEPLAQDTEKTLQCSSSFRIWTTSLNEASDITAELDKIEGKGYRNIALYLLWSDFEPEKEQYSFSFIDELIPLITSRGYKIDLTPVLWTYNLSWKNELDFHTTRTGEVYKYDEVRSETLSVFSQKNKNIVKNSIFALADHCNKTFGESIVQWSAVVSPFGKNEISPFAGPDCSEAAKQAFYTYLQEKYSDIAAFNSRISGDYESWEALKQAEFANLADLAAFEHEIFTGEALADFVKNTTAAFKTASAATPVSLKITNPASVFSAKTMGVSDLYSLVRNSGADTVSFVAEENPVETAFLCDMIASVTGLPVVAELDSATLSAEAETENLKLLSGRAIFAETANFDGDSPDPSLFAAKERQNTRKNEIILVNSLDFLKQPPTEGLYRKLRAAYTGMSLNGEGKPVLLSDIQILENPELLSGVEEIHLGALSETNYLYPALAQTLASYGGRITDNNNAQPTWLDQYGNPIPEEQASAINEKLKNS